MSDSHTHDISRQVKIYITVFVALLVGTFVTVALNYMHFDSVALTVSIALFVAIVKASLVAGFFMHLISEKKAIYAILVTTVFFFAAMMYLVVWSRDQMPRGTAYLTKKPAPVESARRPIEIMSLKAFHIVFIVASILLAFGFGAWLLEQYFAVQGLWYLVFGALSLGAGVALIFYARYFLKKLKDISYL